MKKLLTTAFVALIACGLHAQATGSAPAEQTPATAAKPMPSQANPQMMAKELGLSDQQVEDLNRIDREHQDRMKQLHREGLTPEQKRARTIELRDRKQAEIKKVMTAEQWAQWQKMKQGQRDASLKAREEQKEKREQEKAPHQE